MSQHEVTSDGRSGGSSTQPVSDCGHSAAGSTEHAAPTAAATGLRAPSAGLAVWPAPGTDWAHGQRSMAEPWT